MTTRLNQIFTNLKAAIEEIRANGDNKNGKIDTLNEKNKVAELLAGAQQEIGDFFKSEQAMLDSQKLTRAQYKEKEQELFSQRSSAEEKLNAVKAAMINDFPYHEYDEKNNSFKNIIGLKHIYKDGGYDVMQNSFNDGSYSATTYDKDGNAKGMKLYKNDKAVYSNPEYVAEKLGLKKYGSFGDRVWEFLGFLPSYQEGDYYTDDSIYRWNEKEHLFEYIGINPTSNNIAQTVTNNYKIIYGTTADLDTQIENLDK